MNATSTQFSQERLQEQADEMLDRRLDSIETELRALRGAVERLVRVEERVSQALASNYELRQELNEVYSRLRALESQGGQHKQQLGWIERLFWVLVAGAVAWWGKDK